MKKQSPLKRIFAIRGMGGALTAFAGLIIIYIAFGIINPAVFSGQNVMNLLRSMSKYLIIGIGQSYVLITGNIDLSIGSVVGMSAMIAATLMTMGVNPVVAILITFVCCMIIGVLNGILVGKWKLPPFIATLGTMFVARGVAYMVNGNRNTDAIASGVGKDAGQTFQNVFYYGKTLGVYNTFWIAIIIFIVFFFLLSKTRTGRHIYAIGSNVDAAKLSGVSVVKTTTKTYLVSAFCSFVVGLILCGQAGMGNMEAGKMYEMYSGSRRRYRWYFSFGRNRIAVGNSGRCFRMADTGEWPEYDWRPGRYPETGYRYHRSVCSTSGCCCKEWCI